MDLFSAAIYELLTKFGIKEDEQGKKSLFFHSVIPWHLKPTGVAARLTAAADADADAVSSNN